MFSATQHAVAASRACTASFLLGKVPFGDFIRERVQTKWLAEDKRILIGGKRRCALFDLASEETFCRPEISYHRMTTRRHFSPGDQFSQEFDEPLDPWVIYSDAVPPLPLQSIPGPDVSDTSFPLIAPSNSGLHQSGGYVEEHEGATRHAVLSIALSSSHYRVLRLVDQSFIDDSKPVDKAHVRSLVEKMHSARARAIHEQLLSKMMPQMALWYACSLFRGSSGSFLMGASHD